MPNGQSGHARPKKWKPERLWEAKRKDRTKVVRKIVLEIFPARLSMKKICVVLTV